MGAAASVCAPEAARDVCVILVGAAAGVVLVFVGKYEVFVCQVAQDGGVEGGVGGPFFVAGSGRAGWLF